MRILILHNRYRYAGGEDIVFQAETDLLKKNGHEVETLEFDNEGSISPLKLIHNSDSVKRFNLMVKAFHPQILHVHNLFLKATPGILTAAKKLNLPVVMTLHNYRLICINALLLREGKICEKCVTQKLPFSGVIHSCYKNSKIASIGLATTLNWHRINKTWKNNVDQYIALSAFGKKKILDSSLGLNQNQIEIKPNFIEDPKMGEDKRDNRFLFVGRLSEEKGIKILLEGLKSHKFQLEIIGDGPLKEQIEKVAENNKYLTYRGNCERSYVLERMKSVQALIVPSIWYEPFGMTIIESFACGTPVIASDIGPIAEIITHKENGWLFKAGDPKFLIKQVIEFPNKEAWLKVSNSARKTYLENYTPEVNYEMLMGIYKNALTDYKLKEGS